MSNDYSRQIIFSGLQPTLVLNQRSKGIRVLTRIQRELAACTEFWFYVAFVNKEGVISLLETLKDLQERDIKGGILVSQYLNFINSLVIILNVKEWAAGNL